MHCLRLSAAFLLSALSASSASADVFIDGQPGSYTTLQAAVDAALDGDTLLIEPGLYATAVIDGKGLALQALGNGPPSFTWVRGAIQVRNLPAGSVFSMSDLKVGWFNATPKPAEVDALRLLDCQGHVRVQRCQLEGSVHKVWFPSMTLTRGAALRADNCPRVAVSACHLRGGAVGNLGGELIQNGADGLTSNQSLVALYDSEVFGGEGSHETQPDGGAGGPGVRVVGWGFFASNSSITGGQGGGGDYLGCTPSGDGGPGLVATDAQVQHLETSIEGGPHGIFNTCGHGSDGAATMLENTQLTGFPGLARSLTGPRSIDDGGTLSVNVEGAPGDQVWILRGRAPAFQPTGGPLGIVLVPKLWVLPAAPMGVIPASGTLDVDLWIADIVGPLPSLMIYAQALMVGANGDVRLSGPLHLLVRNT
jgi:hypothetical protein